jgi:16S rRNA (adenine1518-N6/adenine1519-N6)-dimethyltransferase
MKLSEMRQILDTRQLQLTKSLGQNFLHDGNQLRKIADAGELTNADHVLEIGPGLGPLTEELLNRAGKVFAIEKDHRLVSFLKERFGGNSRFELLHADALEFLKIQPRDWTSWKLVANLPYSVGSPILVELALAEHPPERLVATLQLEVVQRLIATPASEAYGLLSLLVQLSFSPAGSFKIPAGCFFPPPDVDSACVTMLRRTEPLLEGSLRKSFSHVVKLSFSQRRKMLLKLLKEEWPEENVRAAFNSAGLAENCRAEVVSLEQFVILTKILGPGAKGENR